MKIEVNINKRNLFILILSVFVITGGFYVYAYNAGSAKYTSPAPPNVPSEVGYRAASDAVNFGHTSDELNVRVGNEVMTLQDSVNLGKLGGGGTGSCVTGLRLGPAGCNHILTNA